MRQPACVTDAVRCCSRIAVRSPSLRLLPLPLLLRTRPRPAWNLATCGSGLHCRPTGRNRDSRCHVSDAPLDTCCANVLSCSSSRLRATSQLRSVRRRTAGRTASRVPGGGSSDTSGATLPRTRGARGAARGAARRGPRRRRPPQPLGGRRRVPPDRGVRCPRSRVPPAPRGPPTVRTVAT